MTTQPAEHLLERVRNAHNELTAQVEHWIEFPDPDVQFDPIRLDADPRKAARHVYQVCTLHHAHFTTATQFRLPYFTAMYLWAAETFNPFAVYAATRGLVEMSAFTCEVARLLRAAVDRDQDWRMRAEAYLATLVRARFGTSDPDIVQRLSVAGVDFEPPKPIHVNDCLRTLAKDPRFSAVMDDYSHLCDYVHQNASIQSAAADGYYVGRAARSSGGGEIRMPSEGPIVRYQYPVELPVDLAIEWTAPRVLDHLSAIVEWHNTIPSHSFRDGEMRGLTGSAMGMDVLLPGDPALGVFLKTPRNAPCPCGSGKKFKRCHGFT